MPPLKQKQTAATLVICKDAAVLSRCSFSQFCLATGLPPNRQLPRDAGPSTSRLRATAASGCLPSTREGYLWQFWVNAVILR